MVDSESSWDSVICKRFKGLVFADGGQFYSYLFLFFQERSFACRKAVYLIAEESSRPCKGRLH